MLRRTSYLFNKRANSSICASSDLDRMSRPSTHDKHEANLKKGKTAENVPPSTLRWDLSFPVFIAWLVLIHEDFSEHFLPLFIMHKAPNFLDKENKGALSPSIIQSGSYSRALQSSMSPTLTAQRLRSSVGVDQVMNLPMRDSSVCV